MIPQDLGHALRACVDLVDAYVKKDEERIRWHIKEAKTAAQEGIRRLEEFYKETGLDTSVSIKLAKEGIEILERPLTLELIEEAGDKFFQANEEFGKLLLDTYQLIEHVAEW